MVLKGNGELEKLVKIKKYNKEQAIKNYILAQKSQFTVASRKSGSMLAETRKNILNAQIEEFEKNRPVLSRKVPIETYSSVAVKMTASTILREEALFKRQKEKEEKLGH